MRIALWLLGIVAVAAIAWAEPGTGTVIVGCNEDDATLLVDGVLIPERTPAVLTLPAGSHIIEVRKATLIAQKKVVEVIDQQQIKVRFELLPPAAPPPPPGTGSGSAIGSGAGSAVGSAAAIGSGSGSAQIGSAVLATGSGSAAPIEAPRPVPAGVAAIDIATTTPKAIAVIDGVPMRDAPCSIDVEPGEHVIAIYAAGMVPAETVVTAKSGQRQKVELTAQLPRKKLDVPAQ